MISHKHNYIFIHIPKTAGTSIKNYLNSLRPKTDYKSPEDPLEKFGHHKLPYYESKYKNTEEFYKFCFLRNPYSRMVSLYKYAKRWTEFDSSFLGFCEFLNIGKKFTNNIVWEEHYEPQSNYISDEINFIGKVESINSDFEHICNHLNIPHKELAHDNKSNNASISICKRSSQIIEEIYENDFEFYETKTDFS